MDKNVYLKRIKPMLDSQEHTLKNNDLQTFFDSLENFDRPDFYKFFLQDINIDVLSYLTVLPDFLFDGLEINELIIPINVKTISHKTFYNSSIKNLIIESRELDPIQPGTFSRSASGVNIQTIEFTDAIKSLEFREKVFDDRDDIVIKIPTSVRDSNRIKLDVSEKDFYKSHVEFF